MNTFRVNLCFHSSCKHPGVEKYLYWSRQSTGKVYANGAGHDDYFRNHGT